MTEDSLAHPLSSSDHISARFPTRHQSRGGSPLLVIRCALSCQKKQEQRVIRLRNRCRTQWCPTRCMRAPYAIADSHTKPCPCADVCAPARRQRRPPNRAVVDGYMRGLRNAPSKSDIEKFEELRSLTVPSQTNAESKSCSCYMLPDDL